MNTSKAKKAINVAVVAGFNPDTPENAAPSNTDSQSEYEDHHFDYMLVSLETNIHQADLKHISQQIRQNLSSVKEADCKLQSILLKPADNDWLYSQMINIYQLCIDIISLHFHGSEINATLEITTEQPI